MQQIIMSSEFRSGAYPDNDDFNFKLPPNPPVAHGNNAQLNAWAEERLAIYASLDAAMTRQIVEAVGSLTELKYRIEEDARQTIQSLGSERETLRREVEDLRLEQVQLQDEIKQARRNLEEVRTQKYAVEREAQGILRESEGERERIQREVNHLTTQMDAMGQQMRSFLQQRFTQLWENFVETLVTQGQPVPPMPESLIALNNEELKINATPVAKPPMPARSTPVAPLIQHKDESELRPAVFAADPISTPFGSVEQIATPDETAFDLSELSLEDDFELQDFDDAPTPRIEGGSPVVRPDKAIWTGSPVEQSPSSSSRPDRRHLTILPPAENETILPEVAANQNQTAPARRTHDQAIEQRIQRLLGRRNAGTNNDNAEAGSEAAQSERLQRNKDRDRAELEEIGAKLGLEVFTPPPIGSIRFGAGFNPGANASSRPNRSAPSDVLPRDPSDELLHDFDKVTPPLVEALPPVLNFMPGRGTTEREPITPPPDFGDEQMEVTTPAPRIGEIGDDFAHQFRRMDLPPPPPIPMPPSSSGPRDEQVSESDTETKLTISNLQGLSLLMMEKVVRGLQGVRHVTVTDFRKGVLEMDVRHSPDVKLDEVLSAMPELKLMLVERGPNSLEFLQER